MENATENVSLSELSTDTGTEMSCLFSELNPMPTEEICTHFNELRSDMVLLYELKTALATCEFELQTLRHQYEALNPGKVTSLLLFQDHH